MKVKFDDPTIRNLKPLNKTFDVTSDNPVDAVDMFRKCNGKTSVLSVCTVFRHGM